MTKTQTNKRSQPQIYAVTNRYGHQRTFSARRDAERYAATERRDGWPATVRDLRTTTHE